jgi:hypothetical protein
MTAGVVHHFEVIQIQVAQRVADVAGLGGVHGLLQPPFEFTPIHQPGQGIVARLIGHLARQAAKLAGVVKHQHQA